jgi:hypothetical protein
MLSTSEVGPILALIAPSPFKIAAVVMEIIFEFTA